MVPSPVRVTENQKVNGFKRIYACELNGWVDRIDPCEKVPRLILRLITIG